MTCRIRPQVSVQFSSEALRQAFIAWLLDSGKSSFVQQFIQEVPGAGVRIRSTGANCVILLETDVDESP